MTFISELWKKPGWLFPPASCLYAKVGKLPLAPASAGRRVVSIFSLDSQKENELVCLQKCFLQTCQQKSASELLSSFLQKQ